jgi:hypothetical protein
LAKNYLARWQYKGQNLKTRLHRSWYLIIKVFSSSSIMLRLYVLFLVFSFLIFTCKDKSDFLLDGLLISYTKNKMVCWIESLVLLIYSQQKKLVYLFHYFVYFSILSEATSEGAKVINKPEKVSVFFLIHTINEVFSLFNF